MAGIGSAVVDIPLIVGFGKFLKVFGLEEMTFAALNAARTHAQGGDAGDVAKAATRGMIDQAIFSGTRAAALKDEGWKLPGSAAAKVRAGTGAGMFSTSALASGTDTGEVDLEEAVAGGVIGVGLPPGEAFRRRSGSKITDFQRAYKAAGEADMRAEAQAFKKDVMPEPEQTKLITKPDTLTPERDVAHGENGSIEEIKRTLRSDDNLFVVDKFGNAKALSKSYDTTAGLPDIDANKGEAIVARASIGSGAESYIVTGGEALSPAERSKYISVAEATREQPGEIVTEADVPTYEAFTASPKAFKETYKRGKEEPRTFYKSERLIRDKMPNRMGKGDFLRFLKKNGVKDEEMYELGLRDLTAASRLDDPKTVTKQEAIDSIETYRINIEEKVLESPKHGWGAYPPDAEAASDLPKYSEYKLPGGKNYREVLFRDRDLDLGGI